MNKNLIIYQDLNVKYWNIGIDFVEIWKKVLKKLNQIKQINEILNAYNKKAKLWHIGTDFFETWKRLSKNLKDKKVNFDNELPTKIKIVEEQKKDKKTKFCIYLDKHNITPIRNKTKTASKSAIRQYLQEGSALSYIAFSPKDKIENNAEFSINPNFWNLKYEFISNSDNDLISNIYNVLINSISSSIYFQLNLSYSLFLCLIYNHDNELLKKLNKKHFIISVTSRNDDFKDNDNKSITNDKTIKYIKHVKENKNTYKIVNLLEENYTFDLIINEMYNNINNPNKNEEVEKENFYAKIKNWNKNNDEEINKLITKQRKKLRDNIIKFRVKNDDENIKYSDLKNSPTNNINIKFQEACHIYDVWRIKKELYNFLKKENKIIELNKKDVINFIFEKLADQNNGIFLNRSCHDLFDNQIVWFDTNKILSFRSEHKELVDTLFGITKDNNPVYIDKNVYCVQMRKYFESRKYDIEIFIDFNDDDDKTKFFQLKKDDWKRKTKEYKLNTENSDICYNLDSLIENIEKIKIPLHILNIIFLLSKKHKNQKRCDSLFKKLNEKNILYEIQYLKKVNKNQKDITLQK